MKTYSGTNFVVLMLCISYFYVNFFMFKIGSLKLYVTLCVG